MLERLEVENAYKYHQKLWIVIIENRRNGVIFFTFKISIGVIFGSKMDFFIGNFWLFAFAGIIPAYIAWIKGHSFWIWWIAGAFFPIVSTFLAIDIDDLNESSK